MAEPGPDETKPDAKPAGRGLALPLLVGSAIAVVAVCAGGGYFVGSTLRSASAKTAALEHAEEEPAPPSHSEDREYVDLAPFTVTLNTPRRDRFVAITVALAINAKNKKAVSDLVTRKKPEIDSRMTLFLSGRTLEDLSGDKNLNRLLRELQDLLNNYLWPNQRPLVENVLIKSLIIQ
jgi:flagellar basal body-associated protein FliL